jgi:hypothetical protein
MEAIAVVVLPPMCSYGRRVSAGWRFGEGETGEVFGLGKGEFCAGRQNICGGVGNRRDCGA